MLRISLYRVVQIDTVVQATPPPVLHVMPFRHVQGIFAGTHASRRGALWSAAVKRVAELVWEGEDKSGRWSGRGPIIL